MPALDQYHHIVRNALEKDGWTITHDPLTLKVGVDRVHIDLGAERVLAAEKGVRKIAVEIKTFNGVSQIADLEAALGQYVLYRMALRQLNLTGNFTLPHRSQLSSASFRDGNCGKPS